MLKIKGRFLIKGLKNSASMKKKLEGRGKIESFQKKVPQPTSKSLVKNPQKIENMVKINIEIDMTTSFRAK